MFFLPIRHCGSAYSKPRVLPILSSASFWCTSRRRSKNKISPRLLRSRSSPSKFVAPSTRSLVCANEIGSTGEPLRCSPQNNVYEKSLLCFHVGCSRTCSAEAGHMKMKNDVYNGFLKTYNQKFALLQIYSETKIWIIYNHIGTT